MAPDVVSISYNDLVNAPLSLGASIEEAFGSHPKCLGIIIVNDLPRVYIEYRKKLLLLAYKFATLDPAVRELYSDPKSRYSFGWSHGKEIMNGKPDVMKGSYYANPIVDEPTVPMSEREAYPEYYGKNIWPDQTVLPEFEDAFKALGRFIFDVGCKLAAACQPFASSQLSDVPLSLSQLLSTSQTAKARLLHYFPPPPDRPLSAEDEAVDSWCGFHLDHSMLTGLCSAMYIRSDAESAPTVIPSPSPSSGLYIRNRGGDLVKVTIPPDCLAFQTGEALQIATAGKLRATPHCVRVGASENADKVSREALALFMQPNTDQPISSTMNFGQFSKAIFDKHYGGDTITM